MPQFYRFRREDFEEIPASRLVKGDMISLGNGFGKTPYGVIPLDDVIHTINGSTVIFYHLPMGARIISAPSAKVKVDLTGETPEVKVEQEVPSEEMVLIKQ
jgi:hypothetical protein